MSSILTAIGLLLLVLALAGIAIQAMERALRRQTIREAWYVEVP